MIVRIESYPKSAKIKLKGTPFPVKFNFDKVIGECTKIWIEETDKEQIIKGEIKLDQEALEGLPELKKKLDLLQNGFTVYFDRDEKIKHIFYKNGKKIK